MALNKVRSGSFSDALKKTVDDLFEQRQALREFGDELGFAKIHSLRWEVYDQRGCYEDALATLAHLVELEYLPYVRSAQRHTSTMNAEQTAPEYKTMRQKVMCCLGYSFALYRTRQYDYAKEVLNYCQTFIEKVLIDEKANPKVLCWGTRARYHYFYGQILRSEQQFSLANEHFMAAIDCARRRLDEKRAQGKPEERLHIEQLFANHCAAKVLAFGLGWNARLRGELSKAWEQLQAARLILWDSHDEFLKGQVDWLSCSILRAQKGVSLELEQILPEISACCERLEKHTDYYLQARREHAILLLNLALAFRKSDSGKCAALLQTALGLVNDYRPRCRGNTRVLALLLETRIRLAANGDNWSAACEGLAREAVALSRTLEHRGIQAEALIVLGEVLSAVPTSRRSASDRTEDPQQWIEAENAFLQIINSRRDNILARCAAYLWLAELELKRDRVVEAASYLRSWESNAGHIEHTWLHQRAESIRHRIVSRKTYLVDYDDRRNIDELSFDLVKFLIDRERSKPAFTPKEAAFNIGVDVRTFHEWEEKVRNREMHRIQLHTPRDKQPIA